MKRTPGTWDWTADRKITAGGTAIAQVLRPDGMGWYEAEANLRDIVEAINERDALLAEVARLKAALADIEPLAAIMPEAFGDAK